MRILAISVILLYGFAISIQVVGYGGSLSSLTAFGCYNEQVCFAESNRSILPDGAPVYRSGGYDGQFYYYIATEIWTGFPVELDARIFRYARIGYPLITGWAALLGPRALLIVMTLLPLAFHLWATIGIYRYARLRADGMIPAVAALLFGINPLSLQSALLHVSDGLALSMGVLSLLLILPSLDGSLQKKTGGFIHTAAWILGAFALLTKETMIAYPGGMAGGFMINAFLREDRSGRIRILKYILFFISMLLPLIAWWMWIGFSPTMASRRGGIPMEGMINYFKEGDALLSGRSFLIVLFIIYLSLAATCMRMIPGKRSATMREMTSEFSELCRALGVVLFLDIVLISFATAEEYWANFANIVRLYIPGLLPLIFSLLYFRKDQKLRTLIFFLFFFSFTLAILVGLWKHAGKAPIYRIYKEASFR